MMLHNHFSLLEFQNENALKKPKNGDHGVGSYDVQLSFCLSPGDSLHLVA